MTRDFFRKRRSTVILTAPGRWPVFALALLLATGCASNVRVSEFQQIATSGASYTNAVDSVLIRTGHLAIEANSLELIENRELAAVSREAFERQNKSLKDLLDELALIRAQILALHDYFQALGAIAGSKAPEAFAAGLNQSTSALASISGTLNQQLGSGGGAFGNVASAATAVAGVGEIIIRRKRIGFLEEELERRYETIDEILELQGQLLEVLSGIAADRQGFVGPKTYEGKVAQPFLGSQPLPCPELWSADRQAALLAGSVPRRIALVMAANQQLRHAWGKLAKHDLGLMDLSALGQAITDALAGPVSFPASEPKPYSWYCPAVLQNNGGE